MNCIDDGIVDQQARPTILAEPGNFNALLMKGVGQGERMDNVPKGSKSNNQRTHG